MQYNNLKFIIDADIIEKIFSTFNSKSPFNLKKSIKSMLKEYNNLDYSDFYVRLALDLEKAYKTIKNSNYLYRSKNNFNIVILKYRMKDVNSNKGKSAGWRIIALVDEINQIFYLLDLYKHSNGKENLSNDEISKLKLLCDEYAKES